MKSKEDISAVFDFIRFMEERSDDAEICKSFEMAGNVVQWITADGKRTELF